MKFHSRSFSRLAVCSALALALAASIGFNPYSSAHARSRAGRPTSRKRVVRGIASYHARTSRLTTAAHGVHRGAKLRVRRPGQPWSKAITVTVDDAGPYVAGRVLDLSTGAFKRIFGSLKRGHGQIEYRVLRDGKGAWTGNLR